jgi:fucose 4-O-acetylase-like acetyltransferase
MTTTSLLPQTPEPLTSAPRRVTWVDTAKGFGIILVVLGHTLRGLVSSDIMSWTPAARFVDTWIYAFHMPLFFFLSGLFLFRSNSKSWVEFASDKLRTIAYPYFVWSVITGMIKAALGSMTNNPRGLSDLRLIVFQPIEQFWFLYVLFLLSIVMGSLLKLGIGPRALLLLAVLIYPGVLPISLGGWGVLELSRGFAIYLALGAIVGSGRVFRTISEIRVGWLAVIAVGGLLIPSLGALAEQIDQAAIKPILALTGTAAVVALAILSEKARIDALIRFLGRYSLEIFVVHTIASAAVRIALQKFAHVTAPAPQLVLGTLAGLILPIVLALACERVGIRFAFTLRKPSKPVT